MILHTKERKGKDATIVLKLFIPQNLSELSLTAMRIPFNKNEWGRGNTGRCTSGIKKTPFREQGQGRKGKKKISLPAKSDQNEVLRKTAS